MSTAIAARTAARSTIIANPITPAATQTHAASRCVSFQTRLAGQRPRHPDSDIEVSPHLADDGAHQSEKQKQTREERSPQIDVGCFATV